MLNKTSQDNQSLASKSLELQDETFKFFPEQLLQDENFKKPFSDKIIKEVEAKTDHGKATVVEEPADQEPMLSRPRREKVKPGQALVLVEEVPASRIPTKSDSSEFFEDIEIKEKQALSMLNEVKAKRDKKRQADSFEVASESKKLKMVVVDDEATTIPKEGSLKEHELKEKEVEKASGERENVQVVILDEEKLKKKEEKKQRKAEKRKQREEAKKEEEEQQRKTEEKARRKAEKKRRKEKRKGEEEEQTERSKRQKEEKEASNKVENLEGEIFERLERNQVLPSEGDEQLEQEPGENLQEQEEKGEKEDREEEEEKKKIETEKEKRDKEERKKQEEVRRKEEERVKNREEKEKEEKLNRLETELKKKKEKQGQNQVDTDNAVEENEGSNLENSEANKGIQEYTQSSGKALALQDSDDTNLDLSVPAKESHNGVHSPISSGALEVSNVGAIPISLSTLIPTIGLASVSI